MRYLLIAGSLVMMAFQASAANYFGFNASGQLVDVSIEDGYGSKRIGLRFPTAELVSTGCYMPKTNSVDLAVDMRKARAAGVNPHFAIACPARSPLAGLAAVSVVNPAETDGHQAKTFSIHKQDELVMLFGE